MLTNMEEIQFFMNGAFDVSVLIVSVTLACAILWYFYYRFYYFRRRIYKQTKIKSNYRREELEQQMLELASEHIRVKRLRFNFVLDDYNQIAYKKLNRIRRSISSQNIDIVSLIPAAICIFDNFQILYREIKKIRSSGTSYERLPILRTGQGKGFPRIYILAKNMVSLSQKHISRENISAMIKAYQRNCKLTDKELWVLPELIGFCLLESIIEVAEEILRNIKLKVRADSFVKKKVGKGREYTDISALLTKQDISNKNEFSFHAHVVYLLKNMAFSNSAINKYLEYHCSSQGIQMRLNEIFTEEGRIVANQEATIMALITSLREINEVDSEELFEELSIIENILSKDPEGYYASMDSVSRGMYRGVIVKLSHNYGIDEEKIAWTCLRLAREGRAEISHSHHVGSYLLGKGYPLLKCSIRGRTLPEKLKARKNVKGFLYFFVSFLILIGELWGIAILISINSTLSYYQYIILLLAGFPLLAGIAMEIANFIFTRKILVKKLPSMDYVKSIPDNARTFVVMPVIISSKEQGVDYLERLERLYLANRQQNLYYALLADYEDALEPSLPKDNIIDQALLKSLEELNRKYPSTYQRFSLFTRERKWNESENCYMCWERKRGKLEEFNSLLCGTKREETSFSILDSSSELLDSVKYVITLDADSNLIWDNAAMLVGIIDHPLNQPVLDMQKGRVKEGYAIIQPSVRNHIIDKKGSLFSMIFGGQSGLDHYSAIVSDIYQDIFNQGTYIGKGVYHVRAFNSLLHGMIPENSVLSHDLLESCYARTAFSSSVKIMDTFPGSVLSYAKREHRWIRGDWQLLPWLFFGKTPENRKVCALSKWKIADNLRRSLVPISKTLLIILNSAWLTKLPFILVPLVFFSDIFNLAIMIISLVKQKLLRPKLAFVYKAFFKELGIIFERAFLDLILIPYRAYIAIDAAIRTVFRIFISRKNLLRWNTAENVDASIVNTKKGYFLSMWSTLVPAALLLAMILKRDTSPLEIIVYGWLSLLWATAFLTAYYISLPREDSCLEETARNLELLNETTLRTWLFFKEFSTKEYNWLCPDSIQHSKRKRISDKTSPTNIGLQLLSILSARDLGIETLGSTINLVDNVLASVSNLPKYKGHLYNWYNIRSLEILHPAYISTVDNGNFLGHMITLKNGLLQQLDQPILYQTSIKLMQKLLSLSAFDGELKSEYTSIGEFVNNIQSIWDELKGRNCHPFEDTKWIKRLMLTINSFLEDATVFEIGNSSFTNCPTLRQLKEAGNKEALAIINRINDLIQKIDSILDNIDFSFLYNKNRMLFYIGYHVESQTFDASCYDLIASESALTSFISLARGEVPIKHWYKLGRPLTMIKGIPCFVSWSGTMFEYLMPNLVMKEYKDSVFSDTAKAAIRQHIEFARQMKIPWGISESQYFRFDLYSNYQYKAFGVPKLRLQPVRRTSLVVAPYASILALEYVCDASLSNLRRLKSMGVYGEYGFYEAVDFDGPDASMMTPYRIVTSFMAHHQGMNMVAINNYLNHGIMRKRLHAEPMIKAAEVLLEEKRQAYLVSTAKRGYTINFTQLKFKEAEYSNRHISQLAPKHPMVGYLSDDKYTLMITSDGDGFSSYKDRMLYRWRTDPYAYTGNYIYIKDVYQNMVWSSSYHPTRLEPADYKVIFSHNMIEFKRRDGDISTHTTVSLSPEHTMEIRKLLIRNHSRQMKMLEITSYMEVVNDSHMAELSHPAFNKLFIESEYLQGKDIFLSKRRSNKSVEKPYVMQMLRTGSKLLYPVEYENDRAKFIGRNNTSEYPDAVMHSKALSNTSGFCNDPIMSLRATLNIKPGEEVALVFLTGVCESREEAIRIGEELKSSYLVDDLLKKYKLQSEVELKYLEISGAQLNAFQNIIGAIFYPSYDYRRSEQSIIRNSKNQSFLWKFGISGDNPILLLKVASIEDEAIIRDVIKAYEYLRINNLAVDLIILIEAKYGYLQEVDYLINDLTSSLKIYENDNEKPGFFVLHTYQLIPAEIDLLYTVARLVFDEKKGIYFKSI